MSQARRSRRIIRRIDPWTVLKVSVLFYLSVYVILLVAGTVLWMAATVSGVRENVENFFNDLGFTGRLVGSQILRASAIGGAILVLVGTGANVLLSVLYNLISDVTGGISVTVEDRPVAKVADVPTPAPARRTARRTEPATAQPKLRPGASKVTR